MQEIKEIHLDPEYFFVHYPETRPFFLENNIFWIFNKKKQRSVTVEKKDYDYLKKIKFGFNSDYDLTIIQYKCQIVDSRKKDTLTKWNMYFYNLFDKKIQELLKDYKNGIKDMMEFFNKVKWQFELEAKDGNYRLNDYITVYYIW